MRCRRCGTAYEGKVGFKAVCQSCGAWLHCCLQCRLFNAGANRCRSSTTEMVRDRDAMNYCEEFQAAARPGRQSDRREDAREKFMGLFEKQGAKGADDDG